MKKWKIVTNRLHFRTCIIYFILQILAFLKNSVLYICMRETCTVHNYNSLLFDSLNNLWQVIDWKKEGKGSGDVDYVERGLRDVCWLLMIIWKFYFSFFLYNSKSSLSKWIVKFPNRFGINDLYMYIDPGSDTVGSYNHSRI